MSLVCSQHRSRGWGHVCVGAACEPRPRRPSPAAAAAGGARAALLSRCRDSPSAAAAASMQTHAIAHAATCGVRHQPRGILGRATLQGTGPGRHQRHKHRLAGGAGQHGGGGGGGGAEAGRQVQQLSQPLQRDLQEEAVCVCVRVRACVCVCVCVCVCARACMRDAGHSGKVGERQQARRPAAPSTPAGSRSPAPARCMLGWRATGRPARQSRSQECRPAWKRRCGGGGTHAQGGSGWAGEQGTSPAHQSAAAAPSATHTSHTYRRHTCTRAHRQAHTSHTHAHTSHTHTPHTCLVFMGK